MRYSIALIAVAAIAGCSTVGPGAAPGTSISSPATTASEPTPGRSFAPSADAPLATSNDGVTLTVTPSAASVRAGDEVAFRIELRNDRPEPLVYGGSPCSFGHLTMSVPLPLEPVGRTWSGREGWFKRFALDQGRAGGGLAATQPLLQTLVPSDCPDASGFEATLAPGATVTTAFTWRAEVVGGLDALPGPIDYVAAAGFDRMNETPSYEPGFTGLRGIWTPVFRRIAIEGHVDVMGDGQHPISIGQAIDGLLEDATFSAWLRTQQVGTCQGVNVLPTTGMAGSIFPPGPSWEIDVFCETGVPRHWAIGAVNPFTAEVRSLTFCDVPCDR